MSVNERLLEASAKGQLADAVQALSDGADPNATDKLQCTPLHLAVYSNAKLLPVLLDAGADVMRQNGIGETALHCCALAGFAENAHVILEHTRRVSGADAARAVANCGNSFRSTPLHYAASVGSKPLMKLLCEYGAEKTREDKRRKTPSDVAMNDQLRQYLMSECSGERLATSDEPPSERPSAERPTSSPFVTTAQLIAESSARPLTPPASPQLPVAAAAMQRNGIGLVAAANGRTSSSSSPAASRFGTPQTPPSPEPRTPPFSDARPRPVPMSVSASGASERSHTSSKLRMFDALISELRREREEQQTEIEQLQVALEAERTAHNETRRQLEALHRSVARLHLPRGARTPSSNR